MPSWKKIITSGSNASLNSLTVINGITGSLFGTASYATQALSSSFATTASFALNAGTTIDTGSFVTTSSFNAFTSSYNTGSFTGSFTGSLFGTSSYAIQALSASWAPDTTTAATASFVTASNVYGPFGSNSILSSSFAQTASFAPLYLPLTGGTINGNVTVNGTASIAFLNVQYESASVIYSSGSNVFGDATNDTQTLNGTVIVSGSQQITGSLNVNGGITGSLFGTASYATEALSASYAPSTPAFPFTGSALITGSLTVTGSLIVTQGITGSLFGTSSNIQGGTANYIPLWNTTTSLSSSVIYQDGTGNLGIGTTSPLGILHLYQPAATTRMVMDGDAGQSKIITFRTNRLQRFGLYCNATAESGANAGSDFVFRAYNDAGTLLSTPLFIKRSSGNIGIGTTTPNATLDVNGNTIVTGSLIVTQGITGSLFGTASFATQALSASYAPTAATFPYTGSALITGSLGITGSLNVTGSSNLTGSLQVSGSARITGTSATPLLVERTGSASNINIQFKNDTTSLYAGQMSNSTFGIGPSNNLVTTSQLSVFTTTGNVVIQNGGTPTDTGYRLDVSGSARVQGLSYLNRVLIGTTADNGSLLNTQGTVTAASAIARGEYLAPTLVASANSDVLVGLDIQPTFTTGSFTGVVNYGARISGSILNTVGTANLYTSNIVGGQAFSFHNSIPTTANYFLRGDTSNTFINAPQTAGFIYFRINNATYGQFSATTGNFILQNVGTLTDDTVNRLQVSGSARITNNLTVTGSATINGGITGSLFGTASFATTASSAPLYLPLTGGTLSGDLTIQKTAATLNITSTGAGEAIINLAANTTGTKDAVIDTSTAQGGSGDLVLKAAGTERIRIKGSTASVIVTGSLEVTNGITGSLFGTASFATTSSYAFNGGVTSIVAGTNITISSATGDVTINSTGGGGGGTDIGLVQAMTVGLQNIF